VQDFHDLKVWQRAHELALAVYAATKSFPRDETYGLTSQIRRAAVSIPSNIAEGCGSGSQSNLSRFLNLSMGSASELQYQVLLARDLAYFTSDDHAELDALISEVKRMLTGLTREVRRVSDGPRVPSP